MTPIGVNCKHIQIMNELSHQPIFLYGYHKPAIECVFNLLHMVHKCEYGPTSQFAHLLGPFLVEWGFSSSYWCRKPIRSRGRHGSIMVNIMICNDPDPPLADIKTRLLGEGFHTLTNGGLFSSPTNVGHHNPPPSEPSVLGHHNPPPFGGC